MNRHQALHDPLTGLPNRVLFGEHVDLAIDGAAARDGTEFALLLTDLDRFKDSNDTLGHAAGGQLLTEIAGRCGALRPADSIARLGGDEFACLIPGASASAAVQAAERIREAAYELLVLDELPTQVEASIGIAVFPEHGTDRNMLLRHADVAMYAAKQAGDGQCIYDGEQDTRAPASLALVSELRRALAEHELPPA